MIYETYRIAKISVDENGKEKNEDLEASETWEEVINKIAFRLEHVMYWEEYVGDGGNGKDYFTIPNKDLCYVETTGGNKYVITESYKDFTKEMQKFEDNLNK